MTIPLIQHIQPKLTYDIHIQHFYGNEKISNGFDYYLTVLTHNSYADFTTQLGEFFQFTIQTKQYQRYFSGILLKITEIASGHYNQFKLLLVSPIQLLKFDRGYHIYKKISLKNLFATIFHKHNLGRIQFKTKQSMHLVEHEAQHNETSYDFICRLAAQYKLFFYYSFTKDNCQIIFSDINHLTQQPEAQLITSDLMRCDYQLFNKSETGCYSTYPLLALPLCIDKQHYLYQIRHFALNSAFIIKAPQAMQDQGYYQYLTLKLANNFIHQSHKKPMIKGLQHGCVKSHSLHIQPSWDRNKTLTPPLKMLFNTPKLNFKSDSNHQVLLAYQNSSPNHPYIIGEIYTKNKKSPYPYKHEQRTIGIQDKYKNDLQLSLDTSPGITLSANQNLSLNIDQKCLIKTQNSISLKSNTAINLKSPKQSIILHSDTAIKIGNSKNFIHITTNKITIQGQVIHLN